MDSTAHSQPIITAGMALVRRGLIVDVKTGDHAGWLSAPRAGDSAVASVIITAPASSAAELVAEIASLRRDIRPAAAGARDPRRIPFIGDRVWGAGISRRTVIDATRRWVIFTEDGDHHPRALTIQMWRDLHRGLFFRRSQQRRAPAKKGT